MACPLPLQRLVPRSKRKRTSTFIPTNHPGKATAGRDNFVVDTFGLWAVAARRQAATPPLSGEVTDAMSPRVLKLLSGYGLHDTVFRGSIGRGEQDLRHARMLGAHREIRRNRLDEGIGIPRREYAADRDVRHGWTHFDL